MIRSDLLAAGIAALLVAGCSKGDVPGDAASAAGSPSLVAVDSAQRGRFVIARIDSTRYTPTIMTTGTVAFSADFSTQVLAPISGPVSRLLVQPGARVTAGQALATVASSDFAAAVANFTKAEAVWRNAKKIADLDEELYANDGIARRDVDQARTDLDGATADRDAALVQLRALGANSAAIASIRSGKADSIPIEAVIRAPISGTLVEKLITPGQLLQAGETPCFTIADLSTMWVMANVFERDIREVHAGARAAILTDAAPDTLLGRVDYVAALVDPSTKATAVRIVVPNRAGLLKRDMLVQVAIASGTPHTGLLVPVPAVLRDDENLPYLFRAVSDSTFGRQQITLGGRVGDKYVVSKGLAAGERVVVDGAVFLQTMGAQ